MNPFDRKSEPLLLLFIMPLAALGIVLGIQQEHPYLSTILFATVAFVVFCPYVHEKSKNPKDCKEHK
ncbi:MAG: hypothetical protein JW947_05950 [Sedimentisphaerales bacterium]|nr:hypothetical protein [Sedimentisphaerales bacterium]